MIEKAQVTLEDGRTLVWVEYGVPRGPAVLFFHGGNDSRLAGRLLADASRPRRGSTNLPRSSGVR